MAKHFKIVLFQTIQFSISTQFSSIWPIDKILSVATTPDQSGPGSDGNKGYSAFPQALELLEPHHQIVWTIVCGGSYPSAEKQSVYSTTPADWTNWERNLQLV